MKLRQHMAFKFGFISLILVLNGYLVNAQNAYQNTSLPVDERVNDLISQMTLAEKIAQLGNQVS